MTFRSVSLAVAACLLTVTAAACGGSSGSTSAPPAASKAQSSPAASSPSPASTPATSTPAASAPAASTPAAAPTTVKVDYIAGIQAFPIEVMQQFGIAKAHNLNLQLNQLSGVAGEDTAIHTGQFQVAFAGWPTIALLRGQGQEQNVSNVYGFYGYQNEIIVAKDSSIKSVADLKGKTIGIAGGPTSANYWMFRVETLKYYGFDPLKQSKIKFGAPPLIVGQFDKGQLDAIILLDPFQDAVLATGKARTIGSEGGIWQQHTGQKPLVLTMVMNTDWAKANTQTAKNFIAAYQQALAYLKAHPEIWPQLAKPLGITSPAAVKLLEQHFNDGTVSQWNQAYFNQQQLFLTTAYSLFGKAGGLPKTIPPGTFTTAYLPSSSGR